ncbi:hypothetical protein QWY31_09465 [Cytophagales bacterium LB-30]|uniref:Phosphate/sulfate permease n=1 Tax=Shiella aurantiaca TaxID=3058365 RepID=A0ABT8F5J7_9BACT|nr:hypothetical protein [Shiella aurantiaca]MDN4165730.1 hypothetical protein [Shiella aurantiaca]
MPKEIKDQIHTEKVGSAIYQLFDLASKEKSFIMLILGFTFLCAVVTPYPEIAMWVGFGLAGYSAIANDSIQTLGTFIASNSNRKWYVLWLYIGIIFVATVFYSWYMYNGDVSNQRLFTKGLEKAPESFVFLQLAAPVILLVLTRLRMPVSTTFLLLNAFTYKAGTIIKIVQKSMVGYMLSLSIGIVAWIIVSKLFSKFAKGKPGKFWMPLQWITSGTLWAVWIVQDAANIAIYLPRSLSVPQFIGFAGFIFFGLGLLFYLKGDKIQDIVNEKSGVKDVRAATVIDLVYALILFYFSKVSTVPMSTTWVFIGLLAGREIAIGLTKERAKRRQDTVVKAFKLMGKDLGKAMLGLLISLLLALAINQGVREEFINLF